MTTPAGAPEASGVSEEVGGRTAECVVLPLKHGGQIDHGGGMVCL